jgi:hypothetical protein
LQEQDNLAVAQGNIALYLINVYRALGGGWEIRLQEEGGEQGRIDETPEAAFHPYPAPGATSPEKKPEDSSR